MSSAKKVGVVILDLAFMSVNFSALTLMAALSSYLVAAGVSGHLLMVSAAAYSAGIFVAFLAGHSRYLESRPRLVIPLAATLAGVPQIVIPYAPPQALPVLRFLQGLVMMCLPIFSAQVGELFVSARPFYMGIIISGIFIGGLVGETIGPALASLVGWRQAFVVLGIAMLVMAGIWFAATPSWALPAHRSEAQAQQRPRGKVLSKFTIVWGFSFFPTIWVVFTLAPMMKLLVMSTLGAPESVASEIATLLEVSYVVWTIILGFIAYVISRRETRPRALFNRFAMVQLISFVIAIIGLALIALHPSIAAVMAGVVIAGIIQGTGPTFWSTPSTAFPRELATRAGYLLGLISNSAAMVGPFTTLAIQSVSPAAAWVSLVIMSAIGAVLTGVGMRMRLPIEEAGS
ncbi:MAG: MFS transporter [Crenarchaeota archaeon]|nr:MFS transporter [Thermoproteota archaeon]